MRALLEHNLKHNPHSVTRVLTHIDSRICSNCYYLPFPFTLSFSPSLFMSLSLDRVLSKSISNSFHKAIPVNLHRLSFVSSMRTMWVLRPPQSTPTPTPTPTPTSLCPCPCLCSASPAFLPHWHWWICTQLERKSWRFRPISQNCALKWGSGKRGRAAGGGRGLPHNVKSHFAHPCHRPN